MKKFQKFFFHFFFFFFFFLFLLISTWVTLTVYGRDCLQQVGTEAAIAFVDFVKRYEKNITAEDVLSGKVKASEVEGLEASVKLALLDKLVEHCKNETLKAKEAKNFGAFVLDLGGEFMFNTWTKISACGNLENVRAMHKLIGKEVVRQVKLARELGK